MRYQTFSHAASRSRFARFFLIAGIGALLTGGAFAQTPIVYNRSVYNAASYMPAGIPAGGIAQGSIFSVFGNYMGPSQPSTANSFPLGTTLAGVSINVIQGSTKVSAIPLYVSATQINAIMPSNAPLGAASLQVVFNNARGNMAPVSIISSAFGIFTALGTGQGPGVLQNFVTATDQPINSPTITAQNGQVITMWGTGLGPVTFPDNVAPTPGNLPVKVEVFVGGVSAPVLYSGRTPCCSGTDQVVFQIPNNAPTGCWVPVYVRTGGTTISNVVSMAIEPSGAVCTTDVLPQVTSVFVQGGKLGEALTLRATTHQDVGVAAPLDITGDYHVSFAFEPNPGPFPFNPALAFPPSGSCTSYTLQGDMLGGDSLPNMDPTTMPLDWGAPLVLTGPHGPKTLTYSFAGARAGYLGGLISNNILSSSLYLDPGSYTVQGFGGTDIGTFSTNFNIPQPVTWTNRLQTNEVNRAQPLTVSWSGGDTGQVNAILGFGEDLPTNSSAVFVCIAPPGATSFTVPTDMLSNLPASRPNPVQSKDVIYLLTLAGSSVENLGASGLNTGFTSFYSIIGKTVVLQ
jgi:trimeric autotransporter adhesin